jgi:SOS-response transcriptional repressor LexA
MGLQNNLRAWREGVSWSREQLAEKTGISAVSVFRIENGRQQPRPNLLNKICRVFGKEPGEFYSSQSNVEEAPIGGRRIPVLDYVQVDQWDALGYSPGDEELRESVMTDLEYPASTFGLRIQGSSMEPEFRAGDVVVIDPTVTPQPGDYVVATEAGGDTTFKQFRNAGLNENGVDVFELHPLNPLYAPMRSDRQQIRIVGVMVEHRTYRQR